MLKRIILAIAVIFPMSIFAQKFGVVNLDEVFKAMPETAQMTASLDEASKKYGTEFEQLQQEFQKLYAEFQTLSQDPTTPESIKQRRISDIQERQQKIEQFRATAQFRRVLFRSSCRSGRRLYFRTAERPDTASLSGIYRH